MLKRVRNERGLVLLVAIVGLVVTGTVLSAFVVSGVLERREANNTRRMGQAFAVAEHGLSETLGGWVSAHYNTLGIGDSTVFGGKTPAATGSYRGSVTRLNNEMFMVDVSGHDAAGGARQSVGALVRLKPFDVDIRAALTTRGATRIGGSAQISGMDTDPYGWTGCPPDSNMAGIRIQHKQDLDFQGACTGGTCVDGVPSIEQDPSMDTTTFFDYGDLDWAALTAMSNKYLSPGTYTNVGPRFTASGLCDLSSVVNWGDPQNPTSPCGSYFPILYSPGDLNISGGWGQGMLLVEGNLSVQGGFEFFGVVIVRQSLKTTGTGGHFNGAVMAANVMLDQNTVLGDALVQYSQCAAIRAMTFAAPAAMLRSRGWLYTY